MTAPSAAPSPELFFQTLTAYQRTEALKGALVLGVFTAIAEGRALQDVPARHANPL